MWVYATNFRSAMVTPDTVWSLFSHHLVTICSPFDHRLVTVWSPDDHEEVKKLRNPLILLERETGFEPATPTLARLINTRF